jgi:hypothetical protein
MKDNYSGLPFDVLMGLRKVRYDLVRAAFERQYIGRVEQIEPDEYTSESPLMFDTNFYGSDTQPRALTHKDFMLQLKIDTDAVQGDKGEIKTFTMSDFENERCGCCCRRCCR